MWEGRELLGTIFLRWRRRHLINFSFLYDYIFTIGFVFGVIFLVILLLNQVIFEKMFGDGKTILVEQKFLVWKMVNAGLSLLFFPFSAMDEGDAL